MKAKRERLQIIHDILEAIKNKGGNIKPTHILYKANLSHKMLDEYLRELITGGFIDENHSKKGKTYSLTQKGYDYINEYKTIIRFMDSFGLE